MSISVVATVSISPIIHDISDALEAFSIASINPTIVLTASQEALLGKPWTVVTKFPNHFPQFEGFVKGIKAILNMGPLPVNWEYFVRPDRPLEAANAMLNIPHLPRPMSRHSQARLLRMTEYYYEQRQFYAENHGPDPFYTPPPTSRPGFLKLFFFALLSYLQWVALPIVNSTRNVVAGFRAAVIFLSFVVFVRPVVGLLRTFRAFTINSLLALGVAFWIVGRLPGWEGRMRGDVGEGEVDPVYRLFMKERKAMPGTGPVLSG